MPWIERFSGKAFLSSFLLTPLRHSVTLRRWLTTEPTKGKRETKEEKTHILSLNGKYTQNEKKITKSVSSRENMPSDTLSKWVRLCDIFYRPKIQSEPPDRFRIVFIINFRRTDIHAMPWKVSLLVLNNSSSSRKKNLLAETKGSKLQNMFSLFIQSAYCHYTSNLRHL